MVMVVMKMVVMVLRMRVMVVMLQMYKFLSVCWPSSQTSPCPEFC